MARKKRAGGRKVVRKVMREFKKGTLESSSGRTVKNRKQAVAIALGEARASGAKIPRKRGAGAGAKRKRAVGRGRKRG